MVTIRSMTLIQAPMERCFRLSLSIDLQLAACGEDTVDGVTSGLMGAGKTVTWRGGHLGVGSKAESLIDMWRPYYHFRDLMTDGSLKMFEHDHHFAPMNDGTRQRDEIRFAATGVMGRLTESLLLQGRITRSLKQRNTFIKRVAESQEWHRYLDGQPEIDMRVYQAQTEHANSDGREFAEL